YGDYYQKGYRIKAVIAGDGSYQGMIEYMPGEFAYRPVDAKGYLFIQCLFVGFKKEYKGKGLASKLLDACIEEAKDAGMKGLAVVTRKGSFMAKKDIFLKNGFVAVDSVKPDFQLLALKIEDQAEDPRFKDLEKNLGPYKEGLYILRSVQCPYTEKNVNAMLDSARNEFGMDPKLVDLYDHLSVQRSPCAFGSFCLIHEGEIVSHHPISKTRFQSIMRKRLK
ncbi:MAG: GNAT family N-acetyltransferase, partial [Candidatus Thermoplasmatota archaeon]|nr:GNAT family N-acetyltransferase [Candidatus Thermoplasmatota archaeon]